MNKTKLATVVILLGFSAFGHAQSCTEYNYAQTPQYDDTSDPTGHTSGDHLFAGTATGTCAYSSSATQYCQIINLAVGTVEPTDSGTLTTSPLGYHVSQFSTSQGSQTTPNASGGNTANSVAVAAWQWCATSGCYFTVTSDPVSVPGAAVWSHTQNAGFSCLAKPDPTYLVSIALTPANTSNVSPGGMTMTATGTYAAGNTQNLSSTATWSSSDTSIATASAGGVIDFVGPSGSATITAKVGSVSGSTTVTTKQTSGDGGGGGGGIAAADSAAADRLATSQFPAVPSSSIRRAMVSI